MKSIISSEALRDLDKHASEFNFPVFDNVHVSFAGARLSVFSLDDYWCIAFEVLGYTENNGNFENYLYAYGNCLEREGLITVETVLSQVAEHPLIDPFTEAWIGDPSDWWVSANGEEIHFEPSDKDYAKAGIMLEGAGPGSLREEDVMRFFIESRGATALYAPIERLLGQLKGCPTMTLFLQTEDWEHPDVSDGYMPSESESIRSIVSALMNNSPRLFRVGRVNTHWKEWVHERV